MHHEALAIIGERPVGQVVPEPRVGALAVGGGVERVAVTGGVEPFEHDARAHDRAASGTRAGGVKPWRSPLTCATPPSYSPATSGPSGPRWRRKRWNSLAMTSPEGSSVGSASASSSAAVFSSRSTKAWTSGSLWTASDTWRS